MEINQLDAKDGIGEKVMITVKINQQISRKNHTEFRKATIIDQTQKLDDTLKKNMLPNFNELNTRGKSEKCASKELKLQVRLFPQSYMDELLSHQTLNYPLSLSKHGEMGSEITPKLV